MKHVNLIGEKQVLVDDEKMMILSYYLIEESSKVKDEQVNNLYGIRIQKQFGGIVESEEVEALSYSKEVVLQLIETLMEFTVTPMTLVEVVDELITLRLCS